MRGGRPTQHTATSGGNLVVGKQDFKDVKQRFLDMGFDIVSAPGTQIEDTIPELDKILGVVRK